MTFISELCMFENFTWIVGGCDLFQACIMFNMTELIFKTKKCKSIEKCPEKEWAFPFHKESVWKKL